MSFAIGCVVRAAIQYQRCYQIDISGIGQIRLTGKKSFSEVISVYPKIWRLPNEVIREGELVVIEPGTTLWAHLILLRLKSQTGDISNLIILRDSTSAESFRKLSVACRWILAHER